MLGKPLISLLIGEERYVPEFTSPGTNKLLQDDTIRIVSGEMVKLIDIGCIVYL